MDHQVHATKYHTTGIGFKRKNGSVKTIQHGHQMMKQMQKPKLFLSQHQKQRVSPFQALCQIKKDDPK
jgi:hypothetical protein